MIDLKEIVLMAAKRGVHISVQFDATGCGGPELFVRFDRGGCRSFVRAPVYSLMDRRNDQREMERIVEQGIEELDRAEDRRFEHREEIVKYEKPV